MRYTEGATQVFHAFVPSEPSLCARLATTTEKLCKWKSHPPGEQTSQDRRLIVAPFPLSNRVQWHRCH
jgi:hypothetical protein